MTMTNGPKREEKLLAARRRMSERELLACFGRMFAAGGRGTAPNRLVAGRSSADYRAGGVIRGVGDDTAVVRPRAGEDLLLTTDSLVEGRHFRRDWLSGRELGWRLAAVNLSDIAAMGGWPLYGLVSLFIPDDVDSGYVLDIQRGVRDHLRRFDAVVIGGNISGIAKTLVCDLTLAGSVRRGKHWPRAARAGDAIVVVGGLGEARAGLEILQAGQSQRSANRVRLPAPSTPSSRRFLRAYKKPKPLLEVARALRKLRAVHGAIDVSDGLALDLVRMCEEGACGCEVRLREVHVSRPMVALCGSRTHAIEYALHGGEDYALLLSVAARSADALVTRVRRDHRLAAAVIGRFTRRQGRYETIDSAGTRRGLEPGGWDHLAGR
jgi:thiamine-monophosphate kinase